MLHLPFTVLATLIFTIVGDVAGKAHPQLLQRDGSRQGARRPLTLFRRKGPIGQMFKEEHNQDNRVDSAALKHDAPLKSPSPAPQVSAWNLHSAVDDAAVPLADYSKTTVGLQPSMPSEFLAGTCKEVCASCVIAATDFPTCKCKANCLKGSDDTICARKASGWLSGFNKHNTPDSSWQGVCNTGKIDCATCLDDKLNKDIAKCREEKNPSLCFSRLKMEMTKESQPVRWCARKNSQHCEKFDHSPVEDNGWTCFNEESKCYASLHHDPKEDIFEYEDSFPNRQTPCIWCNLPKPQ